MGATDRTAYGASWYVAGLPDVPVREPLRIELDVDLCVIGGGLAGLTAALEVARRGWSVAVLEARRVAWNASGRNAGFVIPGFAADPQSLIDKVGIEHARKLWQLSLAGADYVRRTIRETGMAGAELDESGWLHVSQTGGEAKLTAQAELLSREFATPAEFWPAERVREVLRSKRYFGALHVPGAFSINPLNYALGLAAAAEAAGVQIFEATPALEIDPAGVRKRITTASARLRAGHVVLAGNVQIGTVMPNLAQTLVETWAYSAVTEPLGERLQEAVRFKGAVTDNELGDSDYRVVGGDRLLWANRFTVWQGNPQRYARKIAGDIRRVYPQLGKVKTEYAWSGAIGTPVHSMPQIGELQPGVWLLSGFSGHGLNTTAIGGELVARAIVENGQSWQFFQPFELVWAGGRLGRTAVQGYAFANGLRERLMGRYARWRRGPVELPPVERGAEPAVAAEQETAPVPGEPASAPRGGS